MKKGFVEMVFLLDRSGSMRGLEADTIGGFNSLIEKQKEEPGEAVVSLVLFDDQFDVIHHRRDLNALPALTKSSYYVRGSTALIDAMGRSIDKIRQVHRALGEDQTPEKTIFIITTDGAENASRQYHTSELKNMVQQQQEKAGWEFIFLGANMDAFAVAKQYGIKKERAANFFATEEGVQRSYRALYKTVSRFRNNDANFSESLKEELDEENQK